MSNGGRGHINDTLLFDQNSKFKTNRWTGPICWYQLFASTIDDNV